jgi:2-oxoglutarate dehydrogenase E2 component (dihydrolipoamide succinyltransferase)
MELEIKAPALPESVADGKVAIWHKAEGDTVARDELLVEIETDKVVMEVVAPESGVLQRIVANEGATILSDALLGTLRHHALKTTEAVEENLRGSESDNTDAESVEEGGVRAKVNPFVDVTKLEKKIGNHLAKYWFLYLLLGMVLSFEAADIPYCIGLNCGQGR